MPSVYTDDLGYKTIKPIMFFVAPQLTASNFRI